MARPLGEVSQAALALINKSPLTAREVSVKLAVPERKIKDVCYRLTAGGHVRVLKHRRVGHSKRPVAVYAPPCKGMYIASLLQ